MRDGFFKYIYKKRYLSNDKKVIPFVGRGGSVYNSKSTLPTHFNIGILSILLPSLLLLLISQHLHRRKVSQWEEDVLTIDPKILEQAKFYFLLCKSIETREKYTAKNQPQTYDNVCTIEKIDDWNYFPGTSWYSWVRFVCVQEKLEFSVVLNFLEQLGISQNSLKRFDQSISRQNFKKIYLAIQLAKGKDVYVIDNFFIGESEEFEKQCKKLLRTMPYKFLYISSETLRHEMSHKNNSEAKIIVIDVFGEYNILR